MKKPKEKTPVNKIGILQIMIRHIIPILNVLVVIFLFLLPYSLFQGKLFLGGDDTRLFYIYPKEYLMNVSLFSWLNLSSIGWNFSYQTFVPFVLVWLVISEFISSKLILSYFSFSLPLVLGFIYFQRLVSQLINSDKNDNKREIFCGSLFYILSPIVIHNHFLNPLIPIWLIGLIPAVSYYFLRYLKTRKLANILIASLAVIIFSFGYHNIPWGVGFLLPIIIVLPVGSTLFKRKDVLLFVNRFVIFFGIVLLSQSFWLLTFVAAIFDGSSSSFTSKAVSEDVVNNFANSVRVTAQGDIIHPLLNLFHRKIAFDFSWNLKNIYISYYDKIYMVFIVYIIVLFIGVLNFRKYTNKLESKVYFLLLLAFIISLFLFTVNIGPLINLFIFLGNIPGFSLFRNPYDKFALGFTLIYSLLLTMSLTVIKRKYRNSRFNKFLLFAFLFCIILGALSTKQIVVSPLWTTKNIYKNVTIPDEYLDFIRVVKDKVPSTSTIFSAPYGLSLYTIIKDTDTNNVYAGVSPVAILSGVNDISGFLSFNYSPIGDIVNKSIIDKNYDALNDILYTYNINYVFVTNNIPAEVKKSYLFVQDVLKSQDNEFIPNITSKKIYRSINGNYELFTAKKRNSLISSKNLSFQKVNRIKYKISIKNLSKKQELLFNDTFHKDWKLYPSNNKLDCQKIITLGELKTVECKSEFKFFDINELTYLWKRSEFEQSHKLKNNFSNKWIIDPTYVKKNFDSNTYHVNNDGSVDLELILYFKPQGYFYLGVFISFITITVLLLFVLKQK